MNTPRLNAIRSAAGTDGLDNEVERIDWAQIDRVFLDLDGTLLDLHFDNHFWLEHVPLRYAEARGMAPAEATVELRKRYRDIEGTLNWYCIDHWSRELGLDIALLKQEVEHLIAVHPRVIDFLDALAERGKRRVLVTNAHQKALALKLDRTRLGGHFEQIICAHDLGLAKETPGFWSQVATIEPFDRTRTLFIDDNPHVLNAARAFGFRWLLAVAQPDSRGPRHSFTDYGTIGDFGELLPGLLKDAIQSAQVADGS
ncbi:haloacid dehalogenase [Thiocapsa imhoffii]|uniref:Haloacid dehalogenase n=2 Tax=Thiocapsa imhoffii TaxID=382777 RepID=A0A9X0WHC0_9GAMM|nr:haloacid dehalogenase [Thiocapsa imhoffii]